MTKRSSAGGDIGALKIIRAPSAQDGHRATLSPDTDILTRIRRLTGRRILGRKCVNDHWRRKDGTVLLYRTEKAVDTTNWVEVLMVSDACVSGIAELLLENRVYMKFPEYGHGLHYVGNDLWVVDEDLMDQKTPALAPFIVLEARRPT